MSATPASAKDPHLVELGAFLKTRRSELRPEQVGLLDGDPSSRRVSGLRREEVATAVAISHDYYTRIEQGRLAPSAPVLAAIAALLQLSPVERTYVETLAGRAGRRAAARGRSTPVRPQLQRLLDKLTLTPAFVVGKHLDYLAWNPLAGALLLDLDRVVPGERNYVRMLFNDPRMKDFYADWESAARTGVALLRMQAADNPTDARLAKLVGELSLTHPLFRQWWTDRRVAGQDFGSKTIRHPDLGEMTFEWDSFYLSGDLSQHLTMWSPADEATGEKLRILSSWIAAPQTPEVEASGEASDRRGGTSNSTTSQ